MTGKRKLLVICFQGISISNYSYKMKLFTAEFVFSYRHKTVCTLKSRLHIECISIIASIYIDV